MTINPSLTTLVAIVLLGGLAPRGTAQQAQFDLHGDYVVGTSTHAKSWGGGLGVQATFGGKSSPININLSPSIDYVKQQHGGPSQTSLTADVSIQPGGGGSFTPYVGVSAGSNWSGGDAKQWNGDRLGLEVLGGAQIKLGSSRASAKAEERFGYVDGQEHTLTTRLGVLVSY